MLRLFLPPNLAVTAPRDAIAVRVELDLSAAPPTTLVPALALLQRWCGGAIPPRFIQLTRSQLREMIGALEGQPVFFWVNTPQAPIAWHDSELRGVSEYVQAAEQPTPGSTPPSNQRAVSKTSAGSSTPMIVDGSEHFLAVTLPSREHPNYAAALDLLKNSGFILEPSNRRWWLRDRHKTLNFLAEHRARLRSEFGAEFTANFQKNTAHIRPAEAVAEANESGGEFAVTVGIRAGDSDEQNLRAALSANRGYVEDRGRIFLLEKETVCRVVEAQRALAGANSAALSSRRTHRVSAARAAEAQDILETISPGFQPPATWRARSQALREMSALAPAPMPVSLERQLRPYQRIGAAWLWHLWRHDLAGILADEMGLGKTLQALGLLIAIQAQLKGESGQLKETQSPAGSAFNFQPSTFNSSTASLVVCPASLLENWRREALRFAPELRVFVHHGDQRLASESDFAALDLVITSYGTLVRDQELFSKRTFACVIADEAQHIKNRRSQNAVVLRALKARGRFLLTGTPVENSLEDLRSLFEFLLPGYLLRVPEGTRGEERAWFDQRLRAQVAPYILRRTKSIVAPELPEKLEQVIWCELAPAQAALYRKTQETSERELFDLEAGGASEGRLRLAALTQLLRLRQICCDPRLVSNTSSDVGGVPPPRKPAADLEQPTRGEATPPTSVFDQSAKLEAFRELLAEAVDDGHRVLVFSQFTSLLALLREDLGSQQLAYCYLDGSMPARARQAEVDRFQKSSDVPVFLLSLKAGGIGLNLTGADTVVHFDPWWNPAAEAQATDRAHRIGQRRTVTSYKLIAANTVEEKVLALQDTKRALLADIFEASDAAAAKISLTDLKTLLKV